MSARPKQERIAFSVVSDDHPSVFLRPIEVLNGLDGELSWIRSVCARASAEVVFERVGAFDQSCFFGDEVVEVCAFGVGRN
ncbi:MAG TPA: hypothetical protein DDZ88_04400 [Verrucomicrobiales bacterium]|nr:hypothetical protein [Verrucomicrobiales bacterium]